MWHIEKFGAFKEHRARLKNVIGFFFAAIWYI